LKQIIGPNLKTARELAGLRQEVFAEHLGVSRATLSAIENGHVSIDSGVLLRAANLLGRPVSDFFKDEPEEMALLYRAAVDIAAPSDAKLEFASFCSSYRELEQLVGVADNLLTPPAYDYFPHVHSKPDHFAVQVAAAERERLGVGQQEPVDNIFQLLDEQGVRILALEMKDHDVYGLSGFSPQFGPCILLNAVNTVERRVFSLAHEYGHLLMHRQFYRTKEPASGLPKDNNLEQMANVFAANFLVSGVALKAAFQRSIGDKPVGIEDVVFLKRFFKVSADMMIRRIKDLGLVDVNTADSLITEVNRRRPDSTQEIAPLQTDLFGEWKRLNRFDHLARKAALDNLVSLGKLAELLGVNIVEARKQVQEWRRDVSAA